MVILLIFYLIGCVVAYGVLTPLQDPTDGKLGILPTILVSFGGSWVTVLIVGFVTKFKKGISFK